MREILEKYNLTLDNYFNIFFLFSRTCVFFSPSVLLFLKNNHESCEVLTAVLLKLKVLCNIILHCQEYFYKDTASYPTFLCCVTLFSFGFQS